jgi:hypothetical protein
MVNPVVVFTIIAMALLGVTFALQFNPKPPIPTGATNAAVDDGESPDLLQDLNLEGDGTGVPKVPERKPVIVIPTLEDMLLSPDLNMPLGEPDPGNPSEVAPNIQPSTTQPFRGQSSGQAPVTGVPLTNFGGTLGANPGIAPVGTVPEIAASSGDFTGAPIDPTATPSPDHPDESPIPGLW